MPISGSASFGLPPWSDYRRPDKLNFGGPVRDPNTGEWKFPKGYAVEDDWDANCDHTARRSCGDAPPEPLEVSSGGDSGDSGDVGIAIGRAAAAVEAVRDWAPPGILYAERLGSKGNAIRINLANGNMLAQVRPPAAGDFDPVPVLTYNANSNEATEFGNGWYGTFGRRVNETVPDSNADVVTGSGTKLSYGSLDPVTGYYTPPDGARNSLKKNADDTWDEAQPNDFHFRYDTTGKLVRLQDTAGSRWTLSHDAGDRVRRIQNPFGKLTTLAYDASNKIKRIEDAAGRITSLTVNGSGDLTQVTSPELCITEFRYASGKMAARITPEGNRTTITHLGLGVMTGLTVTAPDATRTTYALDTIPDPFNGFRRRVIGPDSLRVTCVYTDEVTLRTVEFPGGERVTYTWDQNRMKCVQDPLGNRTSFSYGTMSDATQRLTRVVDATGGIFSYSYSNPKIEVVKDAAGHRTTIIWDNQMERRLAEIDEDGKRTSYTYQGTKCRSIRNALGNITTFTYSQGDLVAEINALGQRTSYAYYGNTGRRKRRQDALGNITTFLWNDDNQLRVEIDPFGKRTSYTYTGDGDLKTTTNAAARR